MSTLLLPYCERTDDLKRELADLEENADLAIAVGLDDLALDWLKRAAIARVELQLRALRRAQR